MMDNVGGMQRVSMQLIEELHKRDDVEVDTFTINASGKGWIGIITFFFLLKLLWQLPGRARKSNADIIVFSSMVTASVAYFLDEKISLPMITINHGRDVTLSNPLYQKFLPKVFNRLDGVISVSRATRKECIKRGMDPEKGVALPNGFDLEKLRHFPGKKKSRSFLEQAFGIPLQNHQMLLTVGRQVERKGHEWFIRNVFPKINSKVVYVTVGDGPQQENITQAVDEHGLEQHVFMLGRQPDDVLKKTYSASDLFIMPNIPVEGDMEGFGIVLLEANMAETPAVAADLEGIKDVIANGKNGFRIPPEEAEQFAEKIDELLGEGLDELSVRAKEFVENEFSWQHVAGHYVAYFRQICNRKSELNSSK